MLTLSSDNADPKNIMKKKKLQEMTIFRRHMNQLFDIDYWIKTSLSY